MARREQKTKKPVSQPWEPSTNAIERAPGKPVNPGGEKIVNLVVDSVPYIIKARPFTFNGEQRFYVNVNGGTDHVFTWDSELGRMRAIDDEASIMPDALESKISGWLEARVR
jgi:hypothetical protein